MTHVGSRIQLGEAHSLLSVDGLVRLLHESVGPGLVRVLRSKSGETLSCACSPHPFGNFCSNTTLSTAEIIPVPSCLLLSRGLWEIQCQRGTAPQSHGETLCAAASVEGLGSLAVQAEVSHFARQDFRYRRLCSKSLQLGLLSMINLLESQRALEREHESAGLARHLVHSNALVKKEERERLSLQLHDGVIQSMVSAFHMVEAVREMNIQPPEQNAILQRAEETLHQAIRELRGVINTLHTASPEPETPSQ